MDSVSLAEPRRRQKWTLNPRGNLWANDESKFGQKLMEKMGWSKGKGLGANEDGRVQNVSLRLKDNNKGVGFEGHDDTWLAHQSDFQNVLAALNIEHGDKGKEMSEGEKKANLEEISKKSKRRVHYQKFVRGKDLKNYSADDLGCILGTKSEKVKPQSEPTSAETQEETTEENGGDNEKDKNFIQGGNYADYFAKKMADMKARGKLSSVPSSWTETTSRSEKVGDEVRAGFGASTSIEAEEETKKEEEEEPSKKKKSKKSKQNDSERAQENLVEEIPAENKKKKSKKEKKKEESPSEEVLENEGDVLVKKKKSKKSKNREIPLETEELPEKTKKKSKKKQKERTDSVISSNSSDEASEELKKKKRKKSKKERELSEEVPSPDPDSGCEDEDTKYKKAKKIKKEKTKEKKTTYSDEEKENRKRKKESPEKEESPSKRVRSPDDPQSSEDSKFVGFKGSNLWSIPGYGTE